MTPINGKFVLLTGGSRGLGPVIAEALGKRGAHIALAARSEEGLRSTADLLKPFGVRTMTIPVDLTQPGQCEKLVSEVMAEFGRVDLLVNNAGVENEAPFTSLTWDALRQTIDVNLSASLHMALLVLPQMITRGSGHIVILSSIAGKVGLPYLATYSATKAGLAEWAQALRLELTDSGVQLSTIFPGYVSGVGMFASHSIEAPPNLGSVTPEQVADAVVTAIEQNRLEVIVNLHPIRSMLALKALSPVLGDWLMHRMGIVDFQRRKVGL